tara:strand:+ start:131 stop:709 length:579 start_codon:yes stop_codon:yes gene_type:complete
MKNICNGNLTDKEYLEHMIPHHQVAVDISIMLQKKSKSVKMQDILRKLIWIQNYEITMMKDMLNTLPDNISADINNTTYIKTVSDFIEPNKLGLTNTYCDPHFFDPEKHMKHMKHMKLDDIVYIEHMIPHHQVAVDMSKMLIKNTKSDIMLFLAYRIIKSQQDEIIMLNDYLKSLKNNKDFVYHSELLLTYI